MPVNTFKKLAKTPQLKMCVGCGLPLCGKGRNRAYILDDLLRGRTHDADTAFLEYQELNLPRIIYYLRRRLGIPIKTLRIKEMFNNHTYYHSEYYLDPSDIAKIKSKSKLKSICHEGDIPNKASRGASA